MASSIVEAWASNTVLVPEEDLSNWTRVPAVHRNGARTETPEKNGGSSGHRDQEVASLQRLTERVTLRFNV